MKVLFIFGTRPEVIKMAPVIKLLQQKLEIDVKICTTSQHRSMQDQMMNLFGLYADYDLAIMKSGQDLFYITTETINKLKPILLEFSPDLVVVQGDTTTAFAASLAAFYCQIPVAHIEAGLRSYNHHLPFPEEMNRVLTGHLASWHFAPTLHAKKNLLQENIPSETIFVTGNTVIDALFFIKKTLNKERLIGLLSEDLAHIISSQKPYVLITGHRRESFGEGFKQICEAIVEIATKHSNWSFVYPVHLNPNVQKPVYELLSGFSNIHLIEPVEYETFVLLMDNCKIILTDSGGVQEEAPSLGKPVLVMREVTERQEGVAAGTAKLVGTCKEKIVTEISLLMTNPAYYEAMAQAINPYGDGQAANRIVELIQSVLVSTKNDQMNKKNKFVVA